MAKQLLLIRHAKSDLGDLGLKDLDRPLNARGFTNAPEMGQRLFHKNILPDAIVSSPALRAITTAQLIANKIAFNPEKIIQNLNIYQATEAQLLSIVNQFDNALNFVALLGHNPGITEFVNYLSHANINNLPTCGMVLLTFDTNDWASLSGGTGQLLWYDYPKNNCV
jgi:phosphohistidine phosphatase